MTPDQQATLDLIERVLRLEGREAEFEAIKAALLLLWAGELNPGFAELMRQALRELARKGGGIAEDDIEYALRWWARPVAGPEAPSRSQ